MNAAADAAQAKMPPRAGMPGRLNRPGPPRRFWGPTLDGKVINVRSFQEAAPEISKDVPMLIGSVSEEGNRMLSRPTEAEWHATACQAYGEAKATALVDAMKKAHPEKSIRTLVVRRWRRKLDAQQCNAHGKAET